jgi:hypothetical protein
MAGGWCRCTRSPGGRTRAAGQELPLEAVVCATGMSFGAGGSLQMESRTIVELCARPRSLAGSAPP